MSRSRRMFLIATVVTLSLIILSSFATVALFDKLIATNDGNKGTDNVSGDPDLPFVYEFWDLPLDEDGIASVLGHNFGSKGTEEVMFVKSVNLSRQDIFDDPEIYIFNSTNYTINTTEALNSPYPIKNIKAGEGPLVLIVHTHGTEAYIDENRNYYTAADTFRSADIEKNVVAVGAVMVKRLNELGVPTIHDTRMHDLESYSRSYSSSYKAVNEYLTQYPTIKYVIDLHRDSIFSSTNENQKPVTTINGLKTAQVMLVVGSNQSGGHPNWRENLTVALRYQEKLCNYPTLSRPVYIRTGNFNQQLTAGMMLLEIGSCANTLSEAKRAAELAAGCLAQLVLENQTK